MRDVFNFELKTNDFKHIPSFTYLPNMWVESRQKFDNTFPF